MAVEVVCSGQILCGYLDIVGGAVAGAASEWKEGIIWKLCGLGLGLRVIGRKIVQLFNFCSIYLRAE
ncbi:hypothetical protein KSP40_PGU004824 [Platanthera guangdongensis]|uniref:Uncharacterized protein n=1 Tax=Platanthera guangdongensis TaxID=2320717 RepID=A0ABR2N3B4_9ASPA